VDEVDEVDEADVAAEAQLLPNLLVQHLKMHVPHCLSRFGRLLMVVALLPMAMKANRQKSEGRDMD